VWHFGGVAGVRAQQVASRLAKNSHREFLPCFAVPLPTPAEGVAEDGLPAGARERLSPPSLVSFKPTFLVMFFCFHFFDWINIHCSFPVLISFFK
jgi:hypothetical protein